MKKLTKPVFDGDVIIAPTISRRKPSNKEIVKLYRPYETKVDVCGGKEQFPSQITTLIVTNELIESIEKYLKDVIQIIGNTREIEEFSEKLKVIKDRFISYEGCSISHRRIMNVPTIRMDTALYNAHFSNIVPVISKSNYEHQNKPNIDGLKLTESNKALIQKTFQQQCQIDDATEKRENMLLLKLYK